MQVTHCYMLPIAYGGGGTRSVSERSNIKGGKANLQLSKAANYLQVKQLKYTNERLATTYNENVNKRLRHFTEVLKELGLAVPVKL